MSDPEVGLFVLRVRGRGREVGTPAAMIVGAISEAHARVAAYEQHPSDGVWLTSATSVCEPLDSSRKGVACIIYASGAA